MEETIEAGLALVGTEVKSIRNGKCNLKDSYADIDNGEVFIKQMHISPYDQGNIFNVDPLRERKLLLHKSEIRRLDALVSRDGYTLIPLSLYLKEGKVKVSNPETGKKASDCKLTIPSGAPYTAEMEIDIKDDAKATLKMMDPNDEFEAEKSYRVTVELYAKDGYTFAKDLKGTINGIKETKYVTISNKNRIYVDVVMPKIEESEEYTWSKASEWAEPELKEASKENLIPEIFDEANLTKNITRKEFAHTVVKMYEKITGQKAVPIAKNPFTDTKDKEVLKAYNIGITNGTSDTTFSPDALITREQMATMMTRALTKAGKDTSRPESAKLFADDSEFSGYAKDSIYYMSSIEIIKGVGENKFNAKGNASREQALAISIRCVKKLNK